ncbi:unnamed protein product [Onchocerca ochengi]|uniref:UBC core domain-containing protein n=1 Tax=Onchocerca ochengi TaxID=42157 RepID=A0A182EYR4_ONCOC|nr:unnamed protein product [Onchocerca ochengi]
MAKVSKGKVKSLEKFSKEGRFTSSDYEQAKKLVVKMAQSEVSQEDIEKWGLVRDADDLWKWNVIPFEQPEFPPYPPERMTIGIPFEGIGVDLFGPMWVKNGTVSKRWVALFTCLVTRAIHMEVMKKHVC